MSRFKNLKLFFFKTLSLTPCVSVNKNALSVNVGQMYKYPIYIVPFKLRLFFLHTQTLKAVTYDE